MTTLAASTVEIVEVGPRDGFQGIEGFIPTETKVSLVERLASAGLRRIEIGSFVNAKVVPQMRDAHEVLAACSCLPQIDPQVLVANERWAREAIASGAKHLVYVVSASEAHNRNNVRRTVHESILEFAKVVRIAPADVRIRLDLATSFDCPFGGRVQIGTVLSILDQTSSIKSDAEVCLCDTTGRADPAHVADMFEAARERLPAISRWALHAHDTYGMGVANVVSAFRAGVRIFDSSFGGLGGCPFAPGATGNVATEDLVWMFDRVGTPTGIDLGNLLMIARDAASLPGACSGGRVRTALQTQSRNLQL